MSSKDKPFERRGAVAALARILALINEKPRTTKQVELAAFVANPTAIKYIKELRRRGQVCIVGWVKDENGRHGAAIFGPGAVDAVKPKPQDRAMLLRRQRQRVKREHPDRYIDTLVAARARMNRSRQRLARDHTVAAMFGPPA